MPYVFTENESKNSQAMKESQQKGAISTPLEKNTFIEMPNKLNQTVAKTNNQMVTPMLWTDFYKSLLFL